VNGSSSFRQIVKARIARINLKKASGLDLITTGILKELPTQAICRIVPIFNIITRRHYFPQEWKLAKVTMIAESGKPLEEPESYRPIISLLPTKSKLFEKLLSKRIMTMVEKKNVIPESQFGFRNQHATTEQICRIFSKVHTAFEERKHCPGVFLDVKRAFMIECG